MQGLHLQQVRARLTPGPDPERGKTKLLIVPGVRIINHTVCSQIMIPRLRGSTCCGQVTEGFGTVPRQEAGMGSKSSREGATLIVG